MKLTALVSTALMAGFTASGCGGSGSGACVSGTACGGTIIPGSYTIASSCIHTDPVSASGSGSCPGISAAVTDVNMSGSVTFTSDGRYSMTVAASVEETMSIPASCLSQSGMQLTCSQLSSLTQQAMASSSSTPGTLTISCAGSSACTCTLGMSVPSTSQAGTYSTQGTNLTLQADGSSTAQVSPYCVSAEGKQLTIGMTSSTNGTSYQGSLVLTRQ